VRTAAVGDSSSQQPTGIPEPTDWVAEQQADAQIGFVYELLRTHTPVPPPEDVARLGAEVKILCAQIDRLTLTTDGTLCRRFRDHKSGTEYLQKIVPPPLRRGIASDMHRGLNGGHLGLRRAKAALQKRFYWPGWANDVRLAKRQCEQCARHHRPQAKHQGPLQPFLTGEPWERLGIDITGPHPTSSRGNRYVLTIIDHFSKWVELYPMKNQEATTVARIIFDKIICVHGCPLQILTDHGTNFEGQVFQQLCRLVEVDKIRPTVYQPSTNGQIERFHSTMHHMIAKWVASDQRNWDETLPAVAFAYRTSENEATGFTPFYLMYGREARLSADLVYGDVTTSDDRDGGFATDRIERLRAAYDHVRENLNTAAKRRKQYYDLRARPQKFAVGSYVWCLQPRLKAGKYRKWQSPYCGPFEVTKQLGPVTFEIRRSPQSKPWVVHIDKLKGYQALPEPDLIRSEPPVSADEPARPKSTVRRPARYRD